MSYQSTKVSIIGAGKVGSTLAQRIAEKDLSNVTLLDIIPGMPQGIALDLMEARGVQKHDRLIIGTNDYTDTANSQIVVITAGMPRKPGMSRDDLIEINAKIVVEATQKAIAFSPDAILIVVTNPLDTMTYLAWENSGLPTHKVMGMAGILDSSRFQTFIAMELGISVSDIKALVLGSHGDLMVPIVRYTTINGIPITEILDTDTIEKLTERTRNGGAEIVGLMKTGSAYQAPAAAVCIMVESILKNKSRLLPCCVYLNGEYGLKDIFLGVPCELGFNGVKKVLELPLTATELAALQQAAEAVRKNREIANLLLSKS